MRRILSSLAAVAIGFVALAGGAAAPASAATTPDAAKGGYTRVAIDPDVVALLSSAGISVAPTGDATAGGFKGTIAAKFQITAVKKGGTIIKHSGGLKFAAGKTTLSAKRFIISTKAGTVSAIVKGSKVGDAGRVVMFDLSASTMPNLGDFNLALTKTAADAFNATFGAGAVSAGDIFGYATVKA